jgi:DNA-binding transcriptional regulator YiaG
MTNEKMITWADFAIGTSIGQVLQASILTTAALFVGTGGTATYATLARVPQSSSPSYRWERTPDQDQEEFPAVIWHPSDRVSQIRHYLSLNMTDLSRVLRVERPTVYAWLNGSAQPHSANLERLERIHTLARAWRSVSAVPPGRYVRERFEGGETLLDCLSAETLNEPAIRRAFARIKPEVDREQAEKKSSRRRSVADVARRHGFSEVPRSVQQRSFDEETGL